MLALAALALAARQRGYLGSDSVRGPASGIGITISDWSGRSGTSAPGAP